MTYNEFKEMAHEFFTLAKTMSKRQQIEAGFKALGIAYLNLRCSTNEKWQAASILELASQKQDQISLNNQ